MGGGGRKRELEIHLVSQAGHISISQGANPVYHESQGKTDGIENSDDGKRLKQKQVSCHAKTKNKNKLAAMSNFPEKCPFSALSTITVKTDMCYQLLFDT